MLVGTSMATNTNSQEQRKRALDALERRFLVAKAEVLQQQKKSKTGSDDRKENDDISSHFVASLTEEHPIQASSSSKKDTEDGLAYSQLSKHLHENLVNTNVEVKKGSIVDKVLNELLQHGDYARKYLQGSRIKKIDNWILLDNYVAGNSKSTGPIKDLQAHSKRSKKRMSMKQSKNNGMFELPYHLQKYDIFRPMHEMWKGYIMQLLKQTGKNQLAQCLFSADLHGAMILVVECKIKSFSGISGIMIRETAETFGIITQKDKLKVVPKKYSVFRFQVDSWMITMHGDKLTSRNLAL